MAAGSKAAQAIRETPVSYLETVPHEEQEDHIRSYREWWAEWHPLPDGGYMRRRAPGAE